MALQNKYWSNSKFSDWLRGTPKPYALELHEWSVWRQQAQEAHPVRYWIVEEFFDWLQDVITWPNRKIRGMLYYINNRWFSRPNALVAKPDQIKPGQWCDLSHRILPCAFSALEDFVEIESAWMEVAFSDEKRCLAPWWRRLRLYRQWRSPEHGIAHLEWARSLIYDESMGVDPDHELYGKPTPQAQSATEILELYTWWKKVYPRRPDPHDVSGWSQICNEIREKYGNLFHSKLTAQENQKMKISMDKLSQIEAEYEQEETEMLHRLIKIRMSLWT